MKRLHLFLIFLIPFCFAGTLFADEVSRVDLLWNFTPGSPADRSDQHAFFRSFENLGSSVTRCFGSTGAPVLVAPHAFTKIMSAQQAGDVKAWVANGGFLILDGQSRLSEAFGIRLSSSATISSLYNHLRGDDATRFPDEPAFPFIDSLPLAEMTTFYSAQGRPLVAGARLGKGKILYFSTLYDDVSSSGYGRYNDLPLIVAAFFGLKPIPQGLKLEAYFDPGFYFSEPLEKTLARLRESGLRAIHVGAWYGDGPSPYDYKALVDGAHSLGISVYAWFEWPHVGKAFWDDNPECREKTALLTDANVDWRFLMNMENGDCRRKAFERAESLLSRYDWDGVDIAEIYFDPVDGTDVVENFTPFNEDVRRNFKSASGLDPVEIFNEGSPHYWRKDPAALRSFFEYRRRLTSELTAFFLKNVRRIEHRRGKKWEVILTVTDVLDNARLADNIAIDFNAVLALAKKYNATLEIQDQYTEWSKPPGRYEALGSAYKKLLKEIPFLIDINVVANNHPSGQFGFANGQPQGTELLALVKAAAASAARVVLYSENSISPLDWTILSAMAGAKHE